MFRRTAESLPLPSAFSTLVPTNENTTSQLDAMELRSVEIRAAHISRFGEQAQRISLFCVLAAFLSFVGFARGQTTPGVPNGFVPFDDHAYESVDLLNNNVIYHVPIRSKSGAMALNYSLVGNSYIYNAGGWKSARQYADDQPTVNGYIGPQVTGLAIGPGRSVTSTTCAGGSPNTTKYYNWYVVLPDGSSHPVSANAYVDIKSGGGSCLVSSFNYLTIDGTNLMLSVSVSGTSLVENVYTTGGTVVFSSTTPSTIKDTNGNKITLTGTGSTVVTDTMGMTAVTEGGTWPTNTFTWDTVVSTSPAVVTETATSMETYPAFSVARGGTCPNSQGYESDVSPEMLTGITFADGRSLTWTYEPTPLHSPDYTGRFATFTLPEGGTVAYTYSGGSNGLDCTYQTVPVLTRTLGNGDQTTYTLTHPQIGTTANYQAVNTVVDPGGNPTIYTFTGLTATGNSTNAQVITEIQRYSYIPRIPFQVLLTTTLYSYNTAYTSTPSASTISTAQVTFPISELVVYTQLSGMTTWSAVDTKYDSYGNAYYVGKYDFGGASPVFTKTITYGTCSANCLTANPTITPAIGPYILNKPGEIVTTQNGSTTGQVNYTYDPYGNLLARALWTGSAFIGQTTNNLYNLNGTISKSYDVNNNETDYTYASGNYGDGCAGIYPFPTLVKNVGTGLTTSATYDCEGGVKLKDIDANSNAVSYGYTVSGGGGEPYWRVSSSSDPYSATVTFGYPTTSVPTQTASSFSVTSSAIQAASSVTEMHTVGWSAFRKTRVQREPLLIP